MIIQQETIRQLVAFIDGKVSPQDLEQWIVSIDQDESFSRPEQESLMELRLLLLETGEGIRPLDTAKRAAGTILRESGKFQTSARE